MKKCLGANFLSLLALCGPSPSAWSMDIIRDEGSGRVMIASKDCSELIEERKLFATWTLDIDHRECDITYFPEEVEGQCRLDITSCIPASVLKINQTNARTTGPNCYNTALVFQKILPGLRQSSVEELSRCRFLLSLRFHGRLSQIHEES